MYNWAKKGPDMGAAALHDWETFGEILYLASYRPLIF